MRAVGLNTVETYVPWNLHELHPGSYDFGDGGSDFEEFLDIKKFLTLAQEEDLFVILRPGPYICAEWDFGGLPSWLLRNSSMKIRTNDSVYINYVSKYFKVLLGLIEPLQFTKGGSIIAVQIENEYGHIRNEDKSYLRSIIQILRDNNVVELLFTSDTLKSKTAGALPGEYLMTANFNDDAKSNLDTLKTYQSNKPNMVMEYYAGWYDQINEEHNTLDLATYKRVYTDILTYPASVNIYMFVGGTNFGFTAGASDASSDMNNAGLQPVTTSYDYDAPISECGDLTDKYFATADMIGNYSRQKLDLSIGPIDPNRTSYRDIEIKEQILLSEIINNFTDIIESENVMPMELLPINNNSGQNFGYVVYRKKYINLTANAVLKISGYVRDHVLVLVNDLLINPVLSHPDDLNKFGFWRLKDSTIVLTDKDIENATVDLVVENNSRNNYGSLDQFQQYKGLTDDVFIDNEPIRNWQIMPLEFKKSWNLQLSGWHPIITKEATPALYRVSLHRLRHFVKFLQN
ncbi:hypothetical protein GWI33_013940 [Rhynchophorus ferrugineus]|uniref:Glycoside hydrolase 35 catalytic domain-containing protein n=1 Tax=Rhynchophorus ferrugineus TaxID=354439 RepID=A0A834I887_RHYFE|nr:hypothetical protein GWI33_013940 [Rhynchophorus ferrugineus]